jgi:hypothetical protein
VCFYGYQLFHSLRFLYWILELLWQCDIFLFYYLTDSMWTVILSRKILSKILWLVCKNFTEALWMKIGFLMEIFLSAIIFLNVLLDTTLCDKVCQWLATGRWFSSGAPVSSTNKTNCHDISEILLKVALNTITLPYIYIYIYIHTTFFIFPFENVLFTVVLAFLCVFHDMWLLINYFFVGKITIKKPVTGKCIYECM